jgi:hypothetical protein
MVCSALGWRSPSGTSVTGHAHAASLPPRRATTHQRGSSSNAAELAATRRSNQSVHSNDVAPTSSTARCWPTPLAQHRDQRSPRRLDRGATWRPSVLAEASIIRRWVHLEWRRQVGVSQLEARTITPMFRNRPVYEYLIGLRVQCDHPRDSLTSRKGGACSETAKACSNFSRVGPLKTPVQLLGAGA